MQDVACWPRPGAGALTEGFDGTAFLAASHAFAGIRGRCWMNEETVERLETLRVVPELLRMMYWRLRRRK